MQAQGLSHLLMRRSHSQEEGERGWYVYVCVCVYVRAYVINKYITIYVGTLVTCFVHTPCLLTEVSVVI